MSNNSQAGPLKKTITSSRGLLGVEYRTNFDDILNFDGNRCFYLDENEAIKHGYTAKESKQFNQRVQQLANSFATEGIAKTAMLTACEYDGRFFLTDGQGRRCAIDSLNAKLPEGVEKYGIHVSFWHVNDSYEVLQEILKANALHHAWGTDAKVRMFTKIESDGNIKAAYDTITAKLDEFQKIIPNSIGLATLYEAAFGFAAGRWGREYAYQCTFNSKIYWPYFLGFLDNVLNPFLKEIKENYRWKVGISSKKQITTLTQQKAIRAYVKLFKELEKWADSHNGKIEVLREYLINTFLSWARLLNKERVDHLNFKSAPVTYNSFCRDLVEYIPKTNSKLHSEITKFLAQQIKNNS